MKIPAKLTLLIGQDRTTIRIEDDLAGVLVAEVEISPETLSAVLSRLTCVKVDATIGPVECFGKKLEVRNFSFPMPKGVPYKDRIKVAQELAVQFCPEGWVPDSYFGSQESFITVQDQPWAQTNKRRWVEIAP